MATPIIQRPAKYWFADNYPGSTIDPNVGVIHSTEGTSLPWYDGGKLAPNYTATPDFDDERLVWTQHFPDTMSARALRNESGGVQTNTLNCIQIELVGTCDPGTSKKWAAAKRRHIFWPEAPQWALDELAEFVALKHKQHGIRIEGPEQTREAWAAYPASYGKRAAQRFSFDQWSNFYGWCGHQHVPENDHGDPGNLNWAYVENKAKAIVRGTSTAPSAPSTPTIPTKEQDMPLTQADLDQIRAVVKSELKVDDDVASTQIADVMTPEAGDTRALSTHIAYMPARVHVELKADLDEIKSRLANIEAELDSAPEAK